MTAPATDLSDATLLDVLASVDAVIERDAYEVIVRSEDIPGPFRYGPVDEVEQIAHYASLRRGPLAEEAAERGLLWR